MFPTSSVSARTCKRVSVLEFRTQQCARLLRPRCFVLMVKCFRRNGEIYLIAKRTIPTLTLANSENNSGLNPNVSSTDAPTKTAHPNRLRRNTAVHLSSCGTNAKCRDVYNTSATVDKRKSLGHRKTDANDRDRTFPWSQSRS